MEKKAPSANDQQSTMKPSTAVLSTKDDHPLAPNQHSTINHQPSTAFPRHPAETPRAYSAFMAYFQLGHGRSLQAVADKLGENLGTIKNWSSKFDWSERLSNFNSGLLDQHAHAQAEQLRRHAADWADRLNRFREQEWDAAQKLLGAAQCFLENVGDGDLRNMTLGQVSRALSIASKIARAALAGAERPVSSEPDLSPVQRQLLEGVKRVYGQRPVQSQAADQPPAA